MYIFQHQNIAYIEIKAKLWKMHFQDALFSLNIMKLKYFRIGFLKSKRYWNFDRDCIESVESVGFDRDCFG